MKILIIGHQGYVGSGLFKYLSMNHEVMGWGRKDNILNITNQYLLKNNFDVVINCATVMDRVGTYFDTKSLTYEVNVKGMESLVSNMQNTGVRFIFISTKCVLKYIIFNTNQRVFKNALKNTMLNKKFITKYIMYNVNVFFKSMY